MNDKLKERLKDCVYNNPLALSVITDKESINYINNSLPFSLGIEFEVNKNEKFNNDSFKQIPDIINVNVSNSESRFRIPNGIRGLLCLYNLTELLKDNYYLNDESGIHFHVDCTDFFNLITEQELKVNQKWILEELDKWGYKGTYNVRAVNNYKTGWFCARRELKTIEIRICEMSFDYDVLIKRFIHGSMIVKRFRRYCFESNNLPVPEIKFEELDNQKLINYISLNQLNLKNKINKIKNDIDESYKEKEELNDISNLLKNRLIKIK